MSKKKRAEALIGKTIKTDLGDLMKVTDVVLLYTRKRTRCYPIQQKDITYHEKVSRKDNMKKLFLKGDYTDLQVRDRPHQMGVSYLEVNSRVRYEIVK
jgi:hypothetical protein